MCEHCGHGPTCGICGRGTCSECHGRGYEQPDSSWREGDRVYPCRACGGICGRVDDLAPLVEEFAGYFTEAADEVDTTVLIEEATK